MAPIPSLHSVGSLLTACHKDKVKAFSCALGSTE